MPPAVRLHDHQALRMFFPGKVSNGGESGVDCGGACAGCALGDPCRSGADCGSGVCGDGACEENTCGNGVRDGRETDRDCGGLCGPCDDGTRCLAGPDCASRWCHLAGCRPAPSCAAILLGDPTAPDRVYRVLPPGLDEPVLVRCDMATDGGGWTLVGSSAGTPPQDEAMAYSAALVTLEPGEPTRGVWDGLRQAAGDRLAALRFACKLDGAAAVPDVDLSFYDVDWYQRITRGSEEESCSGDLCVEEPCLNGEPDPGETGPDCGGPRCPACLGGEACAVGADCESGRCPAGTCAALRLCDDLWASEVPRSSRVYRLAPEGDSVSVACDMKWDGGGWTLVAASFGQPLGDEAGPAHDDLARYLPQGSHPAVWDGLRELIGDRADLRFACEVGRLSDAGYRAVDLGFYGVDWYGRITVGSEADGCFLQGPGGAGFVGPAPRRRDNLTGQLLERGTPWQYDPGGYLEGEDGCNAPDDFTVDLTDGGMNGDGSDGTDWGLVDGIPRCGSPLTGEEAARTSWWIWARRQAPTCTDGLLDEDEEGLDCGGSCPPCRP
ncbi:MAG: hypothetical protein FJ125_13825 [Deltaproteobacteria bacterium]|nr:hypothetical protein [Deltaproteobacteria bacterium]